VLLIPVLLLALVMPAPSVAARSKELWATVNVCDTERYPNTLGVRASMPGNATRQKMWMRFRASYFDRATERWRDVGGDSRSPWIEVGDARYRTRQAGRRFELDPPLPTTSYVVRGVVEFQWRRKGGKVVRRESEKTVGGHPTGPHGDPYDYSYGICEITFP
jgi:hypothetical protein